MTDQARADDPSFPWTELSDSRSRDLLKVFEVSRQLAATSDLQTLLEIIEKSSLEVLDCERASVFLHDRETDELYSRVATGGQQVRFSTQSGIAGMVFRTGTIINVADAYQDPRFNPEIDRRTGYKTRNILTLPMVSPQGRIVGVFQLLNKRGGPFTVEDAEILSLLAASASVAVENAQR